MKRHLPRMLALFLALLFTGCAQREQPAPPIELPQYFTIYRYQDGRSIAWVLDRDGNTVAEEERFQVLCDAAGQPQCLMRSVEVSAGDRYGDGPVYRTNNRSALYDLEENLLHDWDEVYYLGGFGDYLIRQSRSLSFAEGEDENDPPRGFETALWNYRTGETLMPDVGQILPMEEGGLLLTDIYGYPLCFMDDSGAVQGAYPLPRDRGRLSEIWNGHLITTTANYYNASDTPPVYSLLTRDYTVLTQHRYITGGGGTSLLWAYENSDSPDSPDWSSFLMDTGGAQVYRIEEGGPWYFDDELVVLDRYSEEEERNRYDLVRLSDGAVLGSGYEIFMIDYTEQGAARSFLRYKDGVLSLLDSRGEVTVQREMPDVSYLEFYEDGLIRATIDEAEGYHDLILSPELEELFGGQDCRNIMQLTRWDGNERIAYPLFSVQKQSPGGSHTTYDLLDLSGNLIIGELAEIYDVGEDRLAVRKGFSEGLMDWEGNWIVRQSIFTGLQD